MDVWWGGDPLRAGRRMANAQLEGISFDGPQEPVEKLMKVIMCI